MAYPAHYVDLIAAFLLAGVAVIVKDGPAP